MTGLGSNGYVEAENSDISYCELTFVNFTTEHIKTAR